MADPQDAEPEATPAQLENPQGVSVNLEHLPPGMNSSSQIPRPIHPPPYNQPVHGHGFSNDGPTMEEVSRVTAQQNLDDHENIVATEKERSGEATVLDETAGGTLEEEHKPLTEPYKPGELPQNVPEADPLEVPPSPSGPAEGEAPPPPGEADRVTPAPEEPVGTPPEANPPPGDDLIDPQQGTADTAAADEPPAGPNEGDRFYEEKTGRTLIYTNGEWVYE